MAFSPQASRSSGWLPTMTAATKWRGWATTVAQAAQAATRPERSSATPSRIVPRTWPTTNTMPATSMIGWAAL
jgi:hypothetical protein